MQFIKSTRESLSVQVTQESVSGIASHATIHISTTSMDNIVHIVIYRIITCIKLSMLQVMHAVSECAMRLKVV